MDQPKNGVERALGRIEGRLDAVEKKLAEPVECVQGALVMQKLDYLTTSVAAIGKTSNENMLKIANFDKTIADLGNTSGEHDKKIDDHTFVINDLVDNKEYKTRKLVAIVGAVAAVVSTPVAILVSKLFA